MSNYFIVFWHQLDGLSIRELMVAAPRIYQQKN